MACEDYPCCGHEPGDCPIGGRFTCVGCGRRLPADAASSLCGDCQDGMSRRALGYEDDRYGDDWDYSMNY